MIDFSIKPVIGYVQLRGLTRQDYDNTCARGLEDAMRLERGGIDAIVIENYAEAENGAEADSESKRYMETICQRIRQGIRRARLGVNVLPADLVAAFGLAGKYGLDFVHADIYADKAKSLDTGNLIEVDLEYVSRFRMENARDIPLITTVKPWHAYEVLGNDGIEQSALRAVEYGADAIAVVGKKKSIPNMDDIKRVRSAVDCPVGAGSGINPQTLADFKSADFFLVSGYLKYGGKRSNPVDEQRVRSLMMAKSSLYG